MYERHFGFAEKPFQLTPDSRYFLPTSSTRALVGRLLEGVRARASVMLVLGEEGSGKTSVLRYFLEQAGPDIHTARIPYPVLTTGELLHAILQDLGLPFGGGTLREAVGTLSAGLVEARAAGLKVAVVIDEAHRLPPRVLDQLRVLLALEAEGDGLVTLVLVGEPGLADLVDRFSLGAARRGAAGRFRLEPLSSSEVRACVTHRLQTAGGRGTEIDDSAALRAHALSGGSPRIVGELCDRALAEAARRGLPAVDAALVDGVAREVIATPSEAPGASVPSRRTGIALMAAVLAAAGLLAGRFCVGASGSVDPAASATPVAFEPTPLPVGELPGPFPAVRCAEGANPRAAAIEAIETFLGTPGFDSAPTRVTFEQWQALRLPAIATFRTAGGSCEAAVMPIDDATSQVSDASGHYLMENARLKSSYLGSAIICFVDRDGVLARPERARFAWARGVLEKKGLVRPGAREASVREALARVAEGVGQRQVASVEGALLAALYALQGPPAEKAKAPEPTTSPGPR